MKKLTLGVILSSAALLMGGCATIMSGTGQTINVQAINYNTHEIVPNAKCFLRDSKNIVYPINSNPGNTYISRNYGALQTVCTAHGYVQKDVASGQSFNAWTIGNVIFWPGAIVDAATGAAAKYPSHITVLMKRK